MKRILGIILGLLGIIGFTVFFGEAMGYVEIFSIFGITACVIGFLFLVVWLIQDND